MRAAEYAIENHLQLFLAIMAVRLVISLPTERGSGAENAEPLYVTRVLNAGAPKALALQTAMPAGSPGAARSP